MKRMLKISPNISKSQLIIALEEAGAQGVVINGFGAGYAYQCHEAGLRKAMMMCFVLAFHHEEASSIIRRISAWCGACSHLALCLTGTPSQLHRFISSLENGMYSRMAFYIGEGRWKWIRQLPWRVAPTM